MLGFSGREQHPTRIPANETTPELPDFASDSNSGPRRKIPSSPPDIIAIDRIVAVVNNDVIVNSELRRRIRDVRKSLRNSGTAPPKSEALARQVLQRLIMEHLQLQIAQRNGVRISDGDLNRTNRKYCCK